MNMLEGSVTNFEEEQLDVSALVEEVRAFKCQLCSDLKITEEELMAHIQEHHIQRAEDGSYELVEKVLLPNRATLSTTILFSGIESEEGTTAMIETIDSLAGATVFVCGTCAAAFKDIESCKQHAVLDHKAETVKHHADISMSILNGSKTSEASQTDFEVVHRQKLNPNASQTETPESIMPIKRKRGRPRLSEKNERIKDEPSDEAEEESYSDAEMTDYDVFKAPQRVLNKRQINTPKRYEEYQSLAGSLSNKRAAASSGNFSGPVKKRGRPRKAEHEKSRKSDELLMEKLDLLTQVKQEKDASLEAVDSSDLNKENEAIEESECEINGCDVRFRSKVEKSIHERCHEVRDKEFKQQKSEYTCFVCKARHRLWNAMRQHLWKEHEIDCSLMHCKQCTFAAINTFQVNVHVKKEHSSPADMEKAEGDGRKGQKAGLYASHSSDMGCIYCRRNFASEEALHIHISTCHEKSNCYVCPFCPYKIGNKALAGAHIKNHVRKRPFKCDKCDYMAPNAKTLKVHHQKHSDDKKYKCSQCSYQCGQNTPYLRHLRTAHPDSDELFKCNECEFYTIKKQIFERHMARHQGFVPPPRLPPPITVEAKPELLKEPTMIVKHIGNNDHVEQVSFAAEDPSVQQAIDSLLNIGNDSAKVYITTVNDDGEEEYQEVYLQTA